MITLISDLPDNTLGFSGQGKVTGDDYKNIIVPAIEEKLKSHDKLNLLYHLGENFDGFELSAMFDDAVIGLKHPKSWNKIAFVSDQPAINNLVKFFSHMLPAEVRIFKNSELDSAKKWVTE